MAETVYLIKERLEKMKRARFKIIFDGEEQDGVFEIEEEAEELKRMEKFRKAQMEI